MNIADPAQFPEPTSNIDDSDRLVFRPGGQVAETGGEAAAHHFPPVHMGPIAPDAELRVAHVIERDDVVSR